MTMRPMFEIERLRELEAMERDYLVLLQMAGGQGGEMTLREALRQVPSMVPFEGPRSGHVVHEPEVLKGVLCRLCGTEIQDGHVRFGSVRSGWEHMANECPLPEPELKVKLDDLKARADGVADLISTTLEASYAAEDAAFGRTPLPPPPAPDTSADDALAKWRDLTIVLKPGPEHQLLLALMMLFARIQSDIERIGALPPSTISSIRALTQATVAEQYTIVNLVVALRALAAESPHAHFFLNTHVANLRSIGFDELAAVLLDPQTLIDRDE